MGQVRMEGRKKRGKKECKEGDSEGERGGRRKEGREA